VYKISLHTTASPQRALIPVVLTAVSVPFLLRNQMGMEEPLYALVFLSLTLSCLSKRLFRYWPFLFFLLIISRPEGVFMALAMVPVLYLRRDRRKEVVTGSVIVCILAALLFVFRLVYFQEFLPSPFYHKVFPNKYVYGFLYAHLFFKDYYMYCMLVPLFVLLFNRRARDTQKTILLIFVGVHCIWVILAGACFFPFYRHFVPVIPLLYVLAVSTVFALFTPRSARGAGLIAGCFCLYALAALFLPPANWHFREEGPNVIAQNTRAFFFGPGRYLSRLAKHAREPRYERNDAFDPQTLAGLFIQSTYLPGTTFLYDQMGRLPYNAGTEYIFRDGNGLIDKKIGRAIYTLHSRSSPVLRLYDQLSRHSIRTLFPDVHFYTNAQALIDGIFEEKLDVLMCCTLMRNLVINELGADPRLADEYVPAYYLPGILFLERRGLQKKEFNSAGDLPVVSGIEILQHIPAHPWIVPFSTAADQDGRPHA
jgi:hypothetical protein